MGMKKIIAGWFGILLAATPGISAEPLKITVSIPPQAYLAERIAGDNAVVTVLVPDGKSPHDYAPTPQQVAAIAESRIFFLVGTMPFEAELVRKMQSQCRTRFVSSTKNIARIPAEAAKLALPGGGKANADDHDEGGEDPHIWLDPVNLKLMARNMTQALAELAPERKALFSANCRALEAELTALDERIAALLAPYRDRTLYVYHPAFGYFCRRYGIRQMSIEEGGKDPTPRQIMELIAAARRDRVRVILVQRQFNSRSAEKIGAAIQGRVVPIDILERNLPAVLEQLARQIDAGLTQP